MHFHMQKKKINILLDSLVSIWGLRLTSVINHGWLIYSLFRPMIGHYTLLNANKPHWPSMRQTHLGFTERQCSRGSVSSGKTGIYSSHINLEDPFLPLLFLWFLWLLPLNQWPGFAISSPLEILTKTRRAELTVLGKTGQWHLGVIVWFGLWPIKINLQMSIKK